MSPAKLDVVVLFSFSANCELLHEFRCGAKIINKTNKPSMFSDADLVAFTQPHVITADYNDPAFVALQGLGPDSLCQYAVDTNPSNMYPPAGQDCVWWCTTPSGAASCSAMDPETCTLSGTGSNFVTCANKFFKTSVITEDCEMQIPKDIDINNPPPAVTTTTSKPRLDGCSQGCILCISTSGFSWDDGNCTKCKNGEKSNDWPCNLSDFCKCGSGTQTTTSTTSRVGNGATSGNVPQTTTTTTTKSESLSGGVCGTSCTRCIATSGFIYEDAHCEKCAGGASPKEWPCQTQGFCKCA